MVRIEPNLIEKRRILAQVLDVDDQTVRRWANGSINPIGLSLISLRYYLDFLGYQVAELLPLSGLVKDLGRLLAFRVVDLDELAKLTNYPPEQTSALLAVLRSGRGITTDREIHFQEVVEAYRDELVSSIKKTPKIINLEVSEQYVESTAHPLTIVKPVNTQKVATLSVSSTKEERFRDQVLCLLQFARYFTDDSIPEDTREELRRVVGQRNIFDLKNELLRLCGAKAYQNHR